jgi:cytochrome bd-type quinol oxidase subunit 2
MTEDPKWEVVENDSPKKQRPRGTTRIAGIGLLVVVALVLVLIFPPVLAFVEMAARQLRYLWWLILLLALGIWLIVAARRSKD